jgi:hypothetical protein
MIASGLFQGSTRFKKRDLDICSIRYLVPIHKWSFCPLSALCSKNNPRNITHMHPKGISCGAPAVIFFACLDIEQKSSFLDGHQLEK